MASGTTHIEHDALLFLLCLQSHLLHFFWCVLSVRTSTFGCPAVCEAPRDALVRQVLLVATLGLVLGGQASTASAQQSVRTHSCRYTAHSLAWQAQLEADNEQPCVGRQPRCQCAIKLTPLAHP